MEKYEEYQIALKKMEKFPSRHLGGGDERAHFASNDFLGLAQHPHVKKTAIKSVLEQGVGPMSCQRSVEDKLSDLVGKEGALLFPSAYLAQKEIMSTLMDSGTLVFIDRLCHGDLIDAAAGSEAKILYYEHRDMKHLQSLLEEAPSNTSKWIVTESLFEVDGELADLKRMGDLAEDYGTLIYVDDSRSIGMMGKYGMGLASHRKGIDVVFGGFGNGSGTFAAYLASNNLLREYLLSFNPRLIQATMLPPASLGALNGALDLIPDMQLERQKVTSLSQLLRDTLREKHWEVGGGKSHLIPLMCSSKSEREKILKTLKQANILPSLFSPTETICFTLTALHSEEDVSFLTTTLQSLRENPSLSAV